MNTNNNINNENNENKTFMQKVNGFIKNHKIPTIATACVLVLAIGAGVIFGVTNHNGTTGKFPTFSDSESDKTDLDVPSIEEGDDTSSDDATSSDETDTSEVVSQTPTPNDNKNSTVSKEDTPSTAVSKTETVSKVESTTSDNTSKPSGSSGSQGSGSSTPTTSTPSTSTPTTSTPSTPSDSGSSGSSSDSPSSDNDDLAGIDWEWMTSTSGTQFRGGYVTIGQRTFLVDYDATYGVCKKCGLNTGMLPCREWTCSNCKQTMCSSAFYDATTGNFTCPYCFTEY